MTRNCGILTAVMAFSMAPLAPAADAAAAPAAPRDWRVYIGTYTDGASEGIYLLRFDAQTGRLTSPELAAKIENPSFLALHTTKPLLYAVGVTTRENGEKWDSVTAFVIDPSSGILTQLNRESSMGGGPCHVAVARTGRHVAVANYGGGNIAVLPIREDGPLGAASAFVQHTGSSVNPQRQQEPHAHSVNFDPAGRFVFAADLGIDRIMIYRFDEIHGTLEPNDPPYAQLAPGAGPRHFAFHPSGKYAYSINELDSTITTFAYDAASGRLDTVQSVGTLPEDFTGESTTAEVRVHPSGRFVYGSNRGHDSIVTVGVDPATGMIAPLAWQPTQGSYPRNFYLSPCGDWMLVANQKGDNIVSYRVDAATGRLAPTGYALSVSMPVCLLPARY